MNALAQELRSVTSQVHKMRPLQEAISRQQLLRNAVPTARGITDQLPAFLALAAKQGHFRAFVVSLDRYEPCVDTNPLWSRTQPFTRQGMLRFLSGVPRHVARWGFENGFHVSIGPAEYWDVEPAFGPEVEFHGRHGTFWGVRFGW